MATLNGTDAALPETISSLAAHKGSGDIIIVAIRKIALDIDITVHEPNQGAHSLSSITHIPGRGKVTIAPIEVLITPGTVRIISTMGLQPSTLNPKP